jgi:hypothetical protein
VIKIELATGRRVLGGQRPGLLITGSQALLQLTCFGA